MYNNTNSKINLPSGNNGLGSDNGKLSDNMAWTFSLSILEELFNVVFTLKSIVMFTIAKLINENIIQ